MPMPHLWRARIRFSISLVLIPQRFSSALLEPSLRFPRPNLTPAALALAMPVLTRSRIMHHSNSAKTPHIWNMARPDGVVVSSACWSTIAPSSLKAWHCFAFLVVAAIVWYYLKRPLIVIGMLPDSSWV
jgi:hypothetical protein